MSFTSNRRNQYGNFPKRHIWSCTCLDRASWLYGGYPNGDYKGQIVSTCGGSTRWICLHEHQTRDEARACAEEALACRPRHKLTDRQRADIGRGVGSNVMETR